MSLLTLTGEKQFVPVKSWAPLEINTEIQLRQVAQLPIVMGHVAAMPDAHKGKGSTVGTVIATEKAIIPAAVGVDIGCGMNWVLTDLLLDRCMEKQWELYSAIERAIPLGPGGAHGKRVDWQGFKIPLFANVKDKLNDAQHQLGTLGSGNHFIEMCYDTEKRVSVMLHSGSRGIGNLIGSEYIKTALKICNAEKIQLPNKELAYITEANPEFMHYMHDLNWAQDYAYMNRQVMMGLCLKAIRSVMGDFKISESVNCHHNYTEKEVHFGKEVWLTRKGAIRAQQGDMGIIPGSMGATSKSYIVRGKGCTDAFCSAPHGAGRSVPRGQAKEKFTVADVLRETEGVACKKDESVLDEIQSAYKDIDAVMEQSKDLVYVVYELQKFVNVKG